MRKQMRLMGSSVFPIHMYWEIVRYLITHRISLESIVTDRYPLEQGVEAMAQANTGKSGKIIFEW
jgi:threonine dehydrogenase-like Zn-dependent dehydrogenase